MAKCIFNKKHPNLKGYNKCEITGQIKKGECYFYNYRRPPCPHFKTSLFDSFKNWLGKKFKR